MFGLMGDIRRARDVNRQVLWFVHRGLALSDSLSAVNMVSGLQTSFTISIALGLVVFALGAVAVCDPASPGRGGPTLQQLLHGSAFS